MLFCALLEFHRNWQIMINSCFIVALLASFTFSQDSSSSVSQVHLGLTNDAINCPNGISVNFASSSESPFTVTFKHDGNSSTVESKGSTYTANGYTSDFLHSANLCNLEPNTEYDYSIDSFEASFVSPPAPGLGQRRLRLSAIRKMRNSSRFWNQYKVLLHKPS